MAADALAGSAHAGLACTDCHADITKLPHGKPKAVDCGTCHEKEAAAWRMDLTPSRGGHPAQDCHGTHKIPPSGSSGSLTSHERQMELCGGCHEHLAGDGAWIKAFARSVHGQGITKRGLNLAPACATCHGAHDVRVLKTGDDAETKRDVARPLRNMPRTRFPAV